MAIPHPQHSPWPTHRLPQSETHSLIALVFSIPSLAHSVLVGGEQSLSSVERVVPSIKENSPASFDRGL